MKRFIPFTLIAVSLATAPAVSAQSPSTSKTAATSAHPATPAGARAFLAEVDRELLRLINASNRAGWTQSTYITPDTEVMAAQANEALVTAATNYAKEAFRFDKVEVSSSERRQLYLLKNSLTMSAPPDPKEAEELTRLVASMEGVYGSGKYCPGLPPGRPERLRHPKRSVSTSRRSPRSWLRAGIRSGCSRCGKAGTRFHRRSERITRASSSCRTRARRVLGFKDTGAMWRGKYDMPPDAFAKELDRLWEQLQPLYLSLHTYVRSKLRDKYGAVVPETGPIPAHLLGNLWQQDWSNIYDLVAPTGEKEAFSLTDSLKARKLDPVGMVRIGEKLLHLARLRPAAEDLLRALAVREAARP